MSDVIMVKAVEGRMLPDLKRAGAFVGWARCEHDDKDCGHVVPLRAAPKKPGEAGELKHRGYKRVGAVTVSNVGGAGRYHRMAIRRGDLELAITPKKSGASGSSRESGK